MHSWLQEREVTHTRTVKNGFPPTLPSSLPPSSSHPASPSSVCSSLSWSPSLLSFLSKQCRPRSDFSDQGLQFVIPSVCFACIMISYLALISSTLFLSSCISFLSLFISFLISISSRLVFISFSLSSAITICLALCMASFLFCRSRRCLSNSCWRLSRFSFTL